MTIVLIFTICYFRGLFIISPSFDPSSVEPWALKLIHQMLIYGDLDRPDQIDATTFNRLAGQGPKVNQEAGLVKYI